MSLQILRPPQLMQEAEWEEFALEAFATSDSWDAGAGRVFTFPPLSALWGPFPAEQVLLGGRSRSSVPALTLHGPCLPAGTGGGMGQPCAKALLNCCLHGVGGLGTPRAHPTSPPVYAPPRTPHLGVCVTQSHPSCSCLCGLALPVRV